MEHQSEEQLQEIQEANFVHDMLKSPGWKLIKPRLKGDVDALRVMRNQSNDPAFVMACVRKEDGIVLIDEVIQEIISRGDEAASKSAE